MVDNSTQNPATEADKIIERMVEVAGVKNATALAKELDVTPQAVSSAKKKGKIPNEWITKLASKHDCEPDLIVWGPNKNAVIECKMGAGKTRIPMMNIMRYLLDARNHAAHEVEPKAAEGQSGWAEFLDLEDRPTALFVGSLVEQLVQENERLAGEAEGLRQENKELRSQNVDLQATIVAMLKDRAKGVLETNEARGDPGKRESEDLQESA